MTPPGRVAVIQQIVADEFGVTVDQIRSRNRDSVFSQPRMIAMWLARQTTARSTPEIGRAFGRDHSTVINALVRVDSWMEAEPQMRTRIAGLRARIDAKFAADMEAAALVEKIAGKVSTAYRDWLLEMSKLDGQELLRRFGREP